MPVERVPGFWDALGGGFNKGVEFSREDAQRKSSENLAKAGLASQLFQAGAIDSTTLQGSVQNAGLKDVTVIPSKAEKRKKILDQGQGAVDALSDEQRADLGFKTSTERKQDMATGAVADLDATKAGALQKFASGEHLTDNESELVGLGRNDDRMIKQLSAQDPYLGQVGERYVAAAMNGNQGRIPSGGAQAVSDKAFADYVAARGKDGLGGLTEDQIKYTKTFFDRATQNALIQQTKMDIDKYAAQSGRIHANAAAKNSQQNQTVQWFGKINTAVETLRKAQNDMMKANPALAAALGDPKLAQMPMIAGTLAKYNQMDQQIEAFRQAQSALGNGSMPSNLSELLAGAEGVMKPTGGTAETGGAPAGTNTPDPITAAAQMLISGQGNLQQLQQHVQAGSITQDQYNQIVARAGQLSPPKKQRK